MIRLDSKKYGDCTIGRLWIDNFQCFTLELPWLQNEANISCIPGGVYPIRAITSPRNGEVLGLTKVHGRTAIQIHAGNYTSQIEGCILVGDSLRFLNRDFIPDVTNSKATLKRLLTVARNETLIEIIRT
jgi:hypothetical protein